MNKRNFKDKNTGEEFYYPNYSYKYSGGEIVYIINGKARPELINLEKGDLSNTDYGVRTPTKRR